jgi:imidazole glycerol-phosphate synthase subunit HisH
MTGKIAIIDYGMGNLLSVEKAFQKLGVEAVVTGDPELVSRAPGLVLPGVGAFRDAMAQLRDSGMIDAISESIERGRPFLGICLGLQLLFERSFEDGEHEGLGVFAGTVERLPDGVKIPHMGWNSVKWVKDQKVAAARTDGAYFYFVHSYAVKPADPSIIGAVTDYGVEFVSGVARENVFGLQFHPEKSGSIGLEILRSFGAMCQ